MSRVAIESTDYAGRISRPPWQVPYATFNCLRCGSSLYGRREKTSWSTISGTRHEMQVYRCRCGYGRHYPTENGMSGPVTPTHGLVDPRVAKVGGTRRNAKSNFEYPAISDAATWRRTEVHRYTRWYGCAFCSQTFNGPSATYTHIAKRHPEVAAR